MRGALVGMAVVALALPRSAMASNGWHRSFAPPGGATSIDGIATVPGAGIMAAGGDSTGTSYDTPTVWQRTGHTWTAEPIPADLTNGWGYLSGISGSSDGQAWAVGRIVALATGAATPLVGHWDGTTWSGVSEPWTQGSTTNSGDLTTVSARPGDVWVGGVEDPDVDHEPLGTPLLWHDDGGRWTQVPLVLARTNCPFRHEIWVTAVSATSQGVFVAFNCETADSGRAGAVEFFNGRSWHTVLRLGEGRQVFGLSQVSGDSTTVWAVGGVPMPDGFDRGAAWTGDSHNLDRVRGLPPLGRTVLESVATDGNQVYLVGDDLTNTTGSVALRQTAAGWEQLPGAGDRELQAVTIAPSGRAWVAGPEFGGWLGNQPPDSGVWTRPPG